MPDYRLTIYCAEPSHAGTDFGAFLRTESSWPAERAVANAEGVIGVAVMELNRSYDEILAAEMQRGSDTFGLWTIASDVPAQGTGIHRPRGKDAEMLTLLDEEPRGRVSIRLRCKACGLSYKRRMPEFCAQLDTLATNGITAISLRSLIDTER